MRALLQYKKPTIIQQKINNIIFT